MTFGSTRMMALALAGASVIAVATPADAAWRGRNVAIGAGVGLAAGALIGGAIAANSAPRAYYGDSYYYGSPYASYGSPYASYGYEPSYSYAPAPVYSEPVYESYGYYQPAPTYRYRRNNIGKTGMTVDAEQNKP